MIALLCGVKISAVCYFVSSQSTRVTDRQTDRGTDRQNFDSLDSASIDASRGNKIQSTQPRNEFNRAYCVALNSL